MTVASAGFGVYEAVTKPGAASLLGIGAPVVIWGAAVFGALLMLGLVFSLWSQRCLSSPERLAACSAGVVNAAVPSFNSLGDAIFPFAAMHDRLDVVVKSRYWDLVQTNAGFIFCASDPQTSPVMRCFYRNDEVCGSGLGATIGGAIGVVGGILLGALAGAAIGCAGPQILLCLLALLVALVVAAVVVLVAAIVGGLIGRLAAGASAPTATGGAALAVGDYVTTKGGIVTLDLAETRNARAYWFVDETTAHGRSRGSPEFSFRDPDRNLRPDACPPA